MSPSANDVASESAEEVEFQLNQICVPSGLTHSSQPCSTRRGAAAMKDASQPRCVDDRTPPSIVRTCFIMLYTYYALAPLIQDYIPSLCIHPELNL